MDFIDGEGQISSALWGGGTRNVALRGHGGIQSGSKKGGQMAVPLYKNAQMLVHGPSIGSR